MDRKILLFFSFILSIVLITIVSQSGKTEAAQFNKENVAGNKSAKENSENKYLTESNYDNLPDNFFVFQNYPNPFNPTTTIKYKLPSDNFVTVKIFNSLGNEIETPVNKTQHAGTHEIVFNGEDLSSGVYYAQLKAGGYLKVIKMIHLK